jgi:hypothetical protein
MGRRQEHLAFFRRAFQFLWARFAMPPRPAVHIHDQAHQLHEEQIRTLQVNVA